MKKIKKYIGEAMLLVGAFITTYNLLNFDYDRDCGLSLKIGGACDNPVAYFYDDEVRLIVGLGAALLVAGMLVLKIKKAA